MACADVQMLRDSRDAPMFAATQKAPVTTMLTRRRTLNLRDRFAARRKRSTRAIALASTRKGRKSARYLSAMYPARSTPPLAVAAAGGLNLQHEGEMPR